MRLMRQGLGRVIERRRPGRANLPNSVEITDPDWLTWLELRRQGADLERVGFRNASPAESQGFVSLPSGLLNRRPRPKSPFRENDGPSCAPRCLPDGPSRPVARDRSA